MKKAFLNIFSVGSLFAVTASQSLAQDAPVSVPTDSFFILNSLLFLIGGFLVFWMAAGFTMLEAGLVRSKNVTMQLTKNMSLFSFAAIFYYLIGYNLMYPLGTWLSDEGLFNGVLSGVWGAAVLEAVGVTSDGADDYGGDAEYRAMVMVMAMTTMPSAKANT